MGRKYTKIKVAENYRESERMKRGKVRREGHYLSRGKGKSDILNQSTERKWCFKLNELFSENRFGPLKLSQFSANFLFKKDVKMHEIL